MTTVVPKTEFNLVDRSKFKGKTPHNYKDILTSLVKNPRKIAEVPVSGKKEAKELVRGFHSSATGRKLKKQNYKVETTTLNNGKLVQVRVSRIAAA